MPQKKAKKRLDQLLVDLNIAAGIRQAQALILSGAVEVTGCQQLKPGTSVALPSEIKVKEKNPYVSRGGLKLESAANTLSIECRGKVCMDVGASTGGFTDYMLRHGAKTVYAVDVGRGLLDAGLAKDPKVKNMENTNFRYFSGHNLKEKIEFVTIDVSFISLEKILPKALELLAPGGVILAMVKPQFEARPSQLTGGVVRYPAARAATIEKIKSFALGLGLETAGEADSAVKGPAGNIEHFLLLRKKNADKNT